MGTVLASGTSMWKHPKSLTTEAQPVTECQEQDGEDRKHVVIRSTPLCDPPYDVVWLGSDHEDIRERTISPSLYPYTCFHIHVSGIMPFVHQTHFLFFLDTHISHPPFHLDRATWHGSQRNASRSDVCHLQPR